jgi:hypothetical protein
VIAFFYWELILRKIGFRQLSNCFATSGFVAKQFEILPPEITDTLADLQDEVPDESFMVTPFQLGAFC